MTGGLWNELEQNERNPERDMYWRSDLSTGAIREGMTMDLMKAPEIERDKKNKEI